MNIHWRSAHLALTTAILASQAMAAPSAPVEAEKASPAQTIAKSAPNRFPLYLVKDPDQLEFYSLYAKLSDSLKDNQPSTVHPGDFGFATSLKIIREDFLCSTLRLKANGKIFEIPFLGEFNLIGQAEIKIKEGQTPSFPLPISFSDKFGIRSIQGKDELHFSLSAGSRQSVSCLSSSEIVLIDAYRSPNGTIGFGILVVDLDASKLTKISGQRWGMCDPNKSDVPTAAVVEGSLSDLLKQDILQFVSRAREQLVKEGSIKQSQPALSFSDLETYQHRPSDDFSDVTENEAKFIDALSIGNAAAIKDLAKLIDLNAKTSFPFFRIQKPSFRIILDGLQNATRHKSPDEKKKIALRYADTFKQLVQSGGDINQKNTLSHNVLGELVFYSFDKNVYAALLPALKKLRVDYRNVARDIHRTNQTAIDIALHRDRLDVADMLVKFNMSTPSDKVKIANYRNPNQKAKIQRQAAPNF